MKINSAVNPYFLSGNGLSTDAQNRLFICPQVRKMSGEGILPVFPTDHASILVSSQSQTGWILPSLKNLDVSSGFKITLNNYYANKSPLTVEIADEDEFYDIFIKGDEIITLAPSETCTLVAVISEKLKTWQKVSGLSFMRQPHKTDGQDALLAYDIIQSSQPSVISTGKISPVPGLVLSVKTVKTGLNASDVFIKSCVHVSATPVIASSKETPGIFFFSSEITVSLWKGVFSENEIYTYADDRCLAVRRVVPTPSNVKMDDAKDGITSKDFRDNVLNNASKKKSMLENIISTTPAFLSAKVAPVDAEYYVCFELSDFFLSSRPTNYDFYPDNSEIKAYVNVNTDMPDISSSLSFMQVRKL